MASSVTYTAVSPANSFDIEPSPGVNSLPLPTHPRGPPDQQAGGVDLRLHVGQLEGDGLVLDDGSPNALRSLAYSSEYS